MSYNELSEYSTFDEWFYLIKNGELVYPFLRFPYQEWFDEYIEKINKKTIDEVKELLRCLMGPINRELDMTNFRIYLSMRESGDKNTTKLANDMALNEMYHRIEKGYFAWDGLTWVLELLPYNPYKAIKAIEAYVIAQSRSALPDDRIFGLEQCVQIIMAKFINYENPLEKLTNLKPREFEWIINELYQSMGYNTIMTPATRDGGKDIIASIDRIDGSELVYVECKLYKTTKLEVKDVRSLGYVLAESKANRGVIFCTGYVSDNLRKLDRRIQIWTYDEINILLNAHIGHNWAERLEVILSNQLRKS